MGARTQRVYCVAHWVDTKERHHSQWYGTVQVTVYNLESTLLENPKISFKKKSGLHVSNNYGLQWTAEGDTITGHLVTERNKIPARGTRFFTLGLDHPGDAKLSELLFDFQVNDKPADVPKDTTPPSTPKNLKVAAAGPKSITIAWDPSTDDVGVAHYQAFVDNKGPVQSPVEHCLLKGLSPSTSYKVTVAAVDLAGNVSGRSQPLTVKTTPPLPDAGDFDIRKAAYIDFSRFPVPWTSEYAQKSGLKGFILGFGVVKPRTDKVNDTVISWGGNKTLVDDKSQQNVTADLANGQWAKDDLKKFLKSGGNFAISFGGAANVPLEENEEDVTKIIAQYEAILKNYPDCTHFDFDFEGTFLSEKHMPALERNVAAMTVLVRKHPTLRISYTLPVDAQTKIAEGFSDDGVMMLRLLADAGIHPSLINGMLMEFGQGSPDDMWKCCEIALNAMHRQIKAAWPEWSDAKVWRRIGACPMFGKNNNGKVFSPGHLRKLLKFAKEKDIGCVNGWDAVRDCLKQTGEDSFAFCKIIATEPASMTAKTPRTGAASTRTGAATG